MILAIVVGYLLGIAPFIVPKIIERIDEIKIEKIEIKEKEKEEEQKEIYDEWLNGKKQLEPLINEPRQVDQHELFEEYMTGKVKGA